LLNSTSTLTTAHTNRIVRKNNTTAYTYTIPSALGRDGDAITVNNSGTAGNITIAGSGVTLYKGGVAGSITVAPHTSITLLRESSAIWSA